MSQETKNIVLDTIKIFKLPRILQCQSDWWEPSRKEIELFARHHSEAVCFKSQSVRGRKPFTMFCWQNFASSFVFSSFFCSTGTGHSRNCWGMVGLHQWEEGDFWSFVSHLVIREGCSVVEDAYWKRMQQTQTMQNKSCILPVLSGLRPCLEIITGETGGMPSLVTFIPTAYLWGLGGRHQLDVTPSRHHAINTGNSRLQFQIWWKLCGWQLALTQVAWAPLHLHFSRRFLRGREDDINGVLIALQQHLLALVMFVWSRNWVASRNSEQHREIEVQFSVLVVGTDVQGPSATQRWFLAPAVWSLHSHPPKHIYSSWGYSCMEKPHLEGTKFRFRLCRQWGIRAFVFGPNKRMRVLFFLLLLGPPASSCMVSIQFNSGIECNQWLELLWKRIVCHQPWGTEREFEHSCDFSGSFPGRKLFVRFGRSNWQRKKPPIILMSVPRPPPVLPWWTLWKSSGWHHGEQKKLQATRKEGCLQGCLQYLRACPADSCRLMLPQITCTKDLENAQPHQHLVLSSSCNNTGKL